MPSPAGDVSRFSRAQGAGAASAYDRDLAELRAGHSLSIFEAAGLASATTLLNHLGRRCVSSRVPGLWCTNCMYT